MRKIKKQIVVVCGVLLHKNKVLMQQRSDHELKDTDMRWEFPGGKIEFGESPEEALQREFLEENGRVIKVTKLLPYVLSNIWRSTSEERQVICLLYLCSLIKEKKMVKKDPKVAQIAWVPIERIKDLDSLPGVNETIEVILKD